MFETTRGSGGNSRWAIACLALLSLTSLAVTMWIQADIARERQIVAQITQHLPPSDLPDAQELAGELRLQSRLSVLLIVNLVALGVALMLLTRAYRSSQKSLRNVQVLATDILSSLDQGIITTDQQSNVLSLNPRGRELLSLDPNGTGLALQDLPPDHQPLAEICRKVLEQTDPIRDHDFVVHQNGHVRHLRAGCSPLRDHDGRRQGAVIHVRDVTEKSLMEQRLLRMERYMGLGSLAAGLQHEIKNPLSALSLHVQLLQESLDLQQTPAAVQESLHVLSAEVRRITNVLESFRDFASVARLHRSDTDFTALIEKVVKLTEPQARQQQVEIQSDLPTQDLPPQPIDAVRIEQVLLNLIINALAAMPDGGTITIGVHPRPEVIEVTVADTGTGIPEDLRDKVFDPYFTTRSTGTGMGLALCEKIVHQHEGTIDFQSDCRGTTFTISLPRRCVAEGETA